MHDAIVIGAGPAGLATSHELSRFGASHIVFERGQGIGHTWANLYDGLVLHTGKHLSALPGMAFPASTPIFPARADFLDYLQQYARTFRVPVETGAEVKSISADAQAWTVRLGDGTLHRARAVVVATGIVSNPHVPDIPGRDAFRGRVLHSVDYRRPEPFKDQRALVVGAGNSSGEICAELVKAGAQVTVAVRSGARTVPRQLFGIPIQYFGVALRPFPRALINRAMAVTGRLAEAALGPSPLPAPADAACMNVPLIGFHLVDGIRTGKIKLRRGVSRFTPSGVQFTDGSEQAFDHVILATGYRASLGMLDGAVRRDACGFAARDRRVVSADHPGLSFVGHNYDAAGGIWNIAKDARIAARFIAR